MRQLLASGFALALAASATGCVVDSNAPADMLFDVSFAGQGCGNAGVASLQMTFANGNPETFPCPADGGSINVDVPNVAPGSYRVTFAGVDGGGNVLYGETADFTQTAGGTHENSVNLPAATLVEGLWTFAGTDTTQGMTCAEAGIAKLKITVDGSQVFDNVACTNQGQDAASFSGIQPGNHSFVVDAFDGGGNRLYSSTFNGVSVQAGGDNQFTFNLLPLVKAGLAFSWTFGGDASCGDAGVASVQYNLVDATGSVVDTRTVGCSQEPITFSNTNAGSALDAGVYTLTEIKGIAPSGTVMFQASAQRLFAPAGRTQSFTVDLASAF